MPVITSPRMCYDSPIEGQALINAARLAVKENSTNVPIMSSLQGVFTTPQPLQLALETRKLWKPGRVLKVLFMDGDSQVQNKVEQVAHVWEQYSNIKFLFGDDPEAEIRISFFADPGSWSFLGTDALTRSLSEPTMNLGWLTSNAPDDEYNRVVLHEFGHALGCIHEHQNPSAKIPWNKPAVYRLYAGPPNFWPKEQVDMNFFHKYSTSRTQFSEFDPQSIMLYPVPTELTNGDFEIGWNQNLSEVDATFISTIYPYESAQIVELVIDASPTDADIGEHGEEDLFRFHVTSSGIYSIETGGRTDVLMGLFGPNDQNEQIASDDDSGRGLNARISQELQPGEYFLRIRHYAPRGTGKYTVVVSAAAF